MGKLIVTEFLTADGRMDDPGEWTPAYFDEQVQKIKADEYFGAAALLFGGNTFRTHAAAWPLEHDDFATRLNTMKKYVVSTTADASTWNNTEAITSNAPNAIRKLKDQTDGDILTDGSTTLVDMLLREGLVDQLNLLVFPEIYGRGKVLFQEGTRHKMKVSTCQLLDAGAVHLVYEVDPS